MLTAAQLLAVWEQGTNLASFERALLLLQAAMPGREAEPERYTIGQRDACLLDLRERLFGPALPCLILCPACAEKLELDLNVAGLRQTDGGNRRGSEMPRLSCQGYEIEFRLPDSLDLAAVRGCSDLREGRARLMQRCLLSARLQESGETVTGSLPEAVQDAVAEQMAAADPHSRIELALDCPACGHDWRAVFDIAGYFWSEIQHWAVRLLREVHVLASAYGWREEDILAMTPLRRRLYLDMVGA